MYGIKKYIGNHWSDSSSIVGILLSVTPVNIV